MLSLSCSSSHDSLLFAFKFWYCFHNGNNGYYYHHQVKQQCKNGGLANGDVVLTTLKTDYVVQYTVEQT